MISLSAVESCRMLAEVLSHLVPGGVALAIIENDTIIWSKQSDAFSLDIFEVGTRFGSGNTALQAMKKNAVISQNNSKYAYAKRLSIVSIPILKCNEDTSNTLSMAFPRLRTVAAAFGDYSSILSEMFPEGSFIDLSDLENMAYKPAALKLDIPPLTVGYIWNENDISYKVMKLKHPVLNEIDISGYGTFAFVATYPLYDAENNEEIVATIGIITPKKKPALLPKMSSIIKGDLPGFSATMEEISASSAFIKELNKISQAI